MNKQLGRIILGAVFFILAILTGFNLPGLKIAFFLLSYFISGADVIFKALSNIVRGQVFDENFLMTIATLGAIMIAQYPEAIIVMLFYQIGELFQGYAVDKSRKSIAELMDIKPDYAHLKKGKELITVDPDEVEIGDIIVIKAGEKVPLDAIVIDGNSMIDTSALTGESLPQEVMAGDSILSGTININGLLSAEVTKEYEDSTVSKILDLVENASTKKSESERFITTFARYYTPLVVIIALLLVIIPTLVLENALFSDWLYRSLIFLVVSCPCALVLSIPLSFFGGIGGASRKGILIKGGNYLEGLAKAEVIVFDKTGTLTKGVFQVQGIQSEVLPSDDLLELAAYAESYSNHPIANSLKEAYGAAIDQGRISGVEEVAGYGVISIIDGQKVVVGNHKLMQKMEIAIPEGDLVGTIVHIAYPGRYLGYIIIADEIKDDAQLAIQELKKSRIKEIIMLTGDVQNVAVKIAKELGIKRVYGALLPGDKVAKVEELISENAKGSPVVFVGDGLNDAPVLARADIGIAMGGLGSDAAINAADIVILTDEPSKIATAIRISKRTVKIARQNIIFALGVKFAVLFLSAWGLATMWGAVFADVGVSIIAVLNSFRALKVKHL